MKLLLVSHGSIAQGYCTTLKSFFGIDNCTYSNIDLENGSQQLEKALNDFVLDFKHEVKVICSDLIGGSPNQIVANYASDDIFIISGMNLSLLLQLALTKEIDEQSIEQIVAQARNDIQFINPKLHVKFDNHDE